MGEESGATSHTQACFLLSLLPKGSQQGSETGSDWWVSSHNRWDSRACLWRRSGWREAGSRSSRQRPQAWKLLCKGQVRMQRKKMLNSKSVTTHHWPRIPVTECSFLRWLIVLFTDPVNWYIAKFSCNILAPPHTESKRETDTEIRPGLRSY